MSIDSPEPGTLLNGKYRVLGKLGTGAVGTIWHVRHVPLAVDRALKRIPAAQAVDARVGRRLARQARILAQIDHPAALNVQDYGVSEGAPYLEMEYVRGRTYEEILGAGVPLSLEEVTSLLGQLCEMLECVHTRGIVHRDIKTTKILRIEGRKPGLDLKVLGFGMAMLVNPTGNEDDNPPYIGTPAFASPEQILRGMGQAQGDAPDSMDPVDARSDIYAVGVVLYKALTGVLPFRGGLNQMLFQKVNKVPPGFAEFGASWAPAELERLVLSCLARDMKERPQSVSALWESYQKAINYHAHNIHTDLSADIAGLGAGSGSGSRQRTDGANNASSFRFSQQLHPPDAAALVMMDRSALQFSSDQSISPNLGYSIEDAALVLGMSEEEVRERAESGEFPAIRAGRNWRVELGEFYENDPAREQTGNLPTDDPVFQECQRSVQEHPGLPGPYLRRGEYLVRHRAYGAAISDFTRALRLNLRSPDAFKRRAFAFRKIGDYDRAIRDYTAAVRILPRDANAFICRGYCHHTMGDFDRAVQDYSTAILIDPNEPSAYFNRGLAHRAHRNFPAALEDYTKTIELDPTDVSAFINRGLAHRILGDYERAIADYNQAEKLDPKNPTPLINRGFASTQRGDFDQAIADFTRAIELDNSQAITWYNRGFAFTCKGQYARSIADFTKAIELDPQDASAFYNRAFSLHSQGAVNQAINDYSQAILLGDRDAAAFYNRGVAYRDQGMIDQAVADFTQALQLNANDSQAYFHRALSHQTRGEWDQAIADCSEALRIDPDDSTIYLLRGMLHHQKNDDDLALADLTEAIRLNPNDGEAYRERSRVHLGKGHYFRFARDFTVSMLGRKIHDSIRRRLRRARLRQSESAMPASPVQE